jgi:hypothetical protein
MTIPSFDDAPRLSRNPDVTITMTAESWIQILATLDTYAEDWPLDSNARSAAALLQKKYCEALK